MWLYDDEEDVGREKNDEVGVTRIKEQTHITGKLINNTALHSFQFNGTMENRVCKIGIYSKARCNAMDKETAYTSIMFSQRGRVSRDSEDERAFMALSISITTSLVSGSVSLIE